MMGEPDNLRKKYLPVPAPVKIPPEHLLPHRPFAPLIEAQSSRSPPEADYSFSLRRAKKNKPKPYGARFVRQSIAEGMMIFVCRRLSDKRNPPQADSAISVALR
jgi:hypothetical protein